MTLTGTCAAGAQWRVDGGVWHGCGGSAKEWHESGDIVEDLAVGEHAVSFREIHQGLFGCFGLFGRWRAPEDQIVNIEVGETTTITGTYVESKEGLWEKLLGIPEGDSLLFGLLAVGMLVSDTRIRRRFHP